MPVIAVVAGWAGERRVDFGEDALRAFLHVFDAKLAHQGAAKTDEIAIFLVGRGGFPEFAQGICRALRGRNIRATAVIPAQINGAFTLAALGMDARLMHPYAALGAYDLPALGGARGAPDADTLREIEVFHKLGSGAEFMNAELLAPETLIAIAHQRRQARHARHLLGRLLGEGGGKAPTDVPIRGGVQTELSANMLGPHLALDAAQLNALGLATQLANAQQAALIWQLYAFYEQ